MPGLRTLSNSANLFTIEAIRVYANGWKRK
jgi:hypothetical protein